MLPEFEFCFSPVCRESEACGIVDKKRSGFQSQRAAYNEDSVFMQAVCGICNCRGNLEEITS